MIKQLSKGTFIWYHKPVPYEYEPWNCGFRLFNKLQIMLEWSEGPTISVYCFGPRYTRWWLFGLETWSGWHYASNINWKESHE